MMKKLKILLLSPHGSGEHYHGTATASYRLYAADPDRFDVTLLHGSAAQEQIPIFKEIVCPSILTGKPLDMIRWFIAVRKWLRGNAHRFDVLHTVSGFHIALGPAYYAETRLGLPTVVKIANHNNDLRARGGWKALLGLGKRRQRMVTEVTAMVGLSKEVREELRGYGVSEERIFAIPNSANLSRFKTPTPEARARVREEFGLEDSKVIVFSGQLSLRKQPHLLLEALGMAVKRGLDWRILFVGPEKDDEYGASLHAMMDELGIRDRVKMLGFSKEVEKAYQAADITCLPSMNEAMPSAVVEAMATGMPAVITDFSSASELVPSDDVGAIVEPEGRAIFEALEGFLENPERLRAASKAAKERVVSNFDVQVVLDKYEEVFHWAVANPAH
ncbi:MAG: glycosyltransferase family 4 protein [Phycisphaerales bacterium]|nr:glycosyltransferase family 4 protein [Phycisphaerales bacterium]